jgi:hypothetical protein
MWINGALGHDENRHIRAISKGKGPRVLFGFGQTNAAEYVQSFCWFRFSSR